MFHYLGRKASNEVLHDVDKKSLHSTDHETSVFLLFLSPSSISTSSPDSRFPSAFDDDLGREGSLESFVRTRKFAFFWKMFDINF